jgi:hypothetical protein
MRAEDTLYGSDRVDVSPHLRMEADTVFETLRSLEYRTMDRIKKKTIIPKDYSF